MSKKKLRQQKEAEAKARAAEAAKAEQEKKEAAEAVKAAEAAKAEQKKAEAEKAARVAKPVSKPEKGDGSVATLDELSKWALEQSENIKKICRALSLHAKDIKDHEERISYMEDFLFGDEDVAEDAEEEAAEEEPAEEAKETPKKSTESVDGGVDSSDGPGQAYKYWDGKTRTYGVTANIWAARQISKGVYDIIWVWYRNGQIDHILSDEEIKRYAPR